jgi:RHS repeat-associated protein
MDYLPFGEQIAVGACTTHKFTGKERDSESGLDNFSARYNSSQYGRFVTPDWSARPTPVPFADLANPQSLNLYSYVANNPLNRTDPLGHNWFDIDGQWQWHKGKTYAYTNPQGNSQTVTSNYTGLLVAQATGTDKKTGATTYNLSLYDQNKKVFQGNAFSGGNGNPSIKDGNYTIRLDIRDAKGPNSINPNSPLNNPPAFYGIQQMHNIPTGDGREWDVVGTYGAIRARLNP